VLALSAALATFLFSRPVFISVKLSDVAPLSAVASITAKEPVRITVRIAGKHDDDIEVQYANFATEHEIPIYGLYAQTANKVTFIFSTEEGTSYERIVTVRTDPLPEIYPEIQVERIEADLIAPGMTFFHLGYYDEDGGFTPIPCAIDSFGEVRWYYTGNIGHIMKRSDSENLIIQDGNTLVEMDLLGNRVAVRAEVPSGIHHDMTYTADGKFLILSTASNSFEDGVVEVDGKSAEVLRGYDFRAILDPLRPSQPKNLEPRDWLHLNGIDASDSDNSFVVSGRDQSAVVKVDRDTGDVRWILGNHTYWKEPFQQYLLTPIGEPFSWQWGQHAPMIHPENPQRILLYDNGNERSYTNVIQPKENYSRAVEYEIDEERMEVRQIWEYGTELGSENFTPFIGDANYLENHNRLITFGGITRDLSGAPIELFDFDQMSINRLKISAQVLEVTDEYPAREVMRFIFEDPDPASYRGYRVYQAERYPLYQ
jgi:arylsulfate sulfotransferase